MAIFEDDDKVVLPLGLFALYWLRVYRPLLDADLPQTPRNKGGSDGLGFAKQAYKDLKHISPYDLRIGMKFPEEISAKLNTALWNISNTLV